MKSLILLSMIIFLTNGESKNDYIRIEYAGDTNATMSVLWISKKLLPLSERKVTIPYDASGYDCVVRNDEFLFIKKAINSTARKTFQENDYNGFKITICENVADTSYFITRKNSTSLFLKISAYLKRHKKNKVLIRELYFLRKGNVFDDSGRQIVE